jgi:hypothetical protein
MTTWTDQNGNVLPTAWDSNTPQALTTQFTPYKNIAATNMQAAIQEEVDDLGAQTGATLIGYTPYSNISSATVQNAINEEIDDLAAQGGAALIGFTPTGNIAATTVQAAIAEEITDLSASTGSSLIGHIASGAGAVARTLRSKEMDVVSASDYVVGNGTTDDSANLLAACTALGTAGGTITIPAGVKILVDTDLSIPKNIGIKGAYIQAASSGYASSTAYTSLGAIIINSAATITLGEGSGFSGCLFYRKSMTFPAADASAFAGTAITFGGADCFVERSMILGFNKAIYSTGQQRPRIEYLWHDNVNGIEIESCADIAYINNNHAWPFASIGNGAAITTYIRSGKAYYFHDVADWAKISNCFSYGYVTGYQFTNVNSVRAVSCGADNCFGASTNAWSAVTAYVPSDHVLVGGSSYLCIASNTNQTPPNTTYWKQVNVPLNPVSRGFLVSGTCQNVKLVACQAAAQAFSGATIDTSAGLLTEVDLNVWGSTQHALYVSAGDVHVTGGHIRDSINGIVTVNAASNLSVNSAVKLSNIFVNPLFTTVASSSLVTIDAGVDFGDFTGQVANANLVSPTVASALPLVLPNTGSTFTISGTTNFGTLGYGFAGREVTLCFTGSLIVIHSTGALNAMQLSGNTNFSAVPGSTLTLKHNGVQWYEKSRSFNGAAPTVASGFGTSPTITANGTATFRVNVGTGGTATGGVLNMPSATNGWNATVRVFNPTATNLLQSTELTASTVSSITLTNYVDSTGVVTAWPASTVLIVTAKDY